MQRHRAIGAEPGTASTPAPADGRAPREPPLELLEPLDDFDTTAEVDAAFRTQRRVALGYFGVFLAVTLAVPTLTLVLGWWSEGRIAGMSPNFLMAAGGLYLMFFAVALAAASLADAVEDRMLGGGDEHLGALPGGLSGTEVRTDAYGSAGPEGAATGHPPRPPDRGA